MVSPDPERLERELFLLYRGAAAEESEIIELMRGMEAALGGLNNNCVTLTAQNGPHLEVHVDGLYLSRVPTHFLLACLQPSDEGGETQIYDGRVAADIIEAEWPELVHLEFEYSSLAHGLVARHKLVESVPSDRCTHRTLVFREKVVTNRLLSHVVDWPEDRVYRYLRTVLDRSLVYSHRWHAGDIIAVNNRFSLHGRNAFQGLRKLLRIRLECTI